MDVDVDTKKRFPKLILPEGIAYGKESGFGTAKLGLIYEVNRQFDGQKTDLVDFSIFSLNQIIQELVRWNALPRLQPA